MTSLCFKQTLWSKFKNSCGMETSNEKLILLTLLLILHGTTYDSSIQRMNLTMQTMKLLNIGCQLISTSEEWNMQSCICCMLDSFIRSLLMIFLVSLENHSKSSLHKDLWWHVSIKTKFQRDISWSKILKSTIKVKLKQSLRRCQSQKEMEFLLQLWLKNTELMC